MLFLFFMHETSYEMRISDWSSDVCSSDLADAVRNPEEWTGKVIGLAQKRPIEVTPHERGQVVELVSSKHGAKRFADARPAPSAEWMCVFDPNVRYGAPRKRSWNDAEEIDPLDLIGLDDDPPRPPKEAHGQRNIHGFNPLNWKHSDASYPETPR